MNTIITPKTFTATSTSTVIYSTDNTKQAIVFSTVVSNKTTVDGYINISLKNNTTNITTHILKDIKIEPNSNISLPKIVLDNNCSLSCYSDIITSTNIDLVLNILEIT